jgi:tight adherence protein C
MLLWISLSLTALCLGSLIWLFMLPRRTHARHNADASADGAAPRLPWYWPWIDAWARVCRPFLAWRWRAVLEQRMGRAGLSQGWSAEHLVALQLWLALLAGAAGGFALLQTGLAPASAAGLAVPLALLAAAWPLLRLSSRQRERQRALQRDLPFFLDLLTLCVEAGQSLQGALQQAASNGPRGALTQELAHVLAQLRTGVARADAFEALADRTGVTALRQLALTLRQVDQFGMSLGPILRAQSTQQRDERFLRAEKLALEAPVKMLFPLVFCIFPCTFLIIGFPLVGSFLRLG